jgi:hypothetical protein
MIRQKELIMIGSRHIVKTSLVAALASAFVGCGTASAQQSHSPFNAAGVKLQFNSTAAAAASTTHTGTIQVTFNITIKSAIPTSTPIYCEADLSASDSGYLDFYSEGATATAVRNGNTATCKASIPYQWVMAGSGGGYAVWYYIYAQPTNGNAGNILYPSGLRSTSHQIISAAPFPTNGQTVTYSYNVVL